MNKHKRLTKVALIVVFSVNVNIFLTPLDNLKLTPLAP